MLLSCRIDNALPFWRRYPDHDVPLVEFSLLEIVCETASAHYGFPVEVLPREPGHFALLISGRADDLPAEIETATIVSHHLNLTLRRLLDCTLNVIFSKPFLQIVLLPEVFGRLTGLHRHRFYRERPVPLYENQLTPFCSWSTEAVLFLESEYAELIAKDSSDEEWNVWILRVRTTLEKLKPDPENAIQWLEKLAPSNFQKSSEYWSVDHDLTKPTLAGAPSLAEALGLFRDWIVQQRDREERSTRLRPEIARAVAYIHDHLESGLSQEKVAQMIQMSASHFGYLFKKELGIPYLDYVLQSRIERSKQYLGSGLYRHYELAEKVGFNSYPHFAAMFKKSTGMTLSEYKNTIKPNIMLDRKY
ncbi:helix-turn-helix domain-containing protein [Paenibacillus koleovorans]|uniref:helix-turn-helix domain-containing protein n=1 Tax=Paenibacillus koleovorans TaxID=121608 RepID=UPI0013E2FB92|nr:AraC family transcriptional regulator [Paenibacillus koleovorans]